MLCEIRAPRGLSGALFTHRDTHTLPFIWAGPLTSTEKGFFQGCLAANCWVDWRAAQMKEKPARTFPPSPLPLQGAGPTSGPSPPAQLPLPPEAHWADAAPTLAGGPGTGATRSQAPAPPPPPPCQRVPGFRAAGLHETKYCEAPLRVS